ncbi:MAG: G5 domain-containing protein [Ruminococcus sp.]|jgi:3D (Asp-Asp-Asp) domain-containing protein|nr:G5 domain-containing protein [Ruminococcus sp.]
MLIVKKNSARRLLFIPFIVIAAILLITLTVGKNVYAVDDEGLSETEETAIALAALINNTPAPVTTDSSPAILANRVTEKITTDVAPIEYSTIYKEDETLQKGVEVVMTEGTPGQRISNVKRTYMAGRLKTVELISEFETPPQDKVVHVGSKVRYLPDRMISELEIPEWFSLDANGVPTNYSSVLTGKGVAYWANPGAKTASGRTAKPGMVAVDPSIIPYGTKLYIASADNNLVYGYAIAADTGTSLIEGVCLVDLFMNSYDECVEWGAHEVNVYILD